MVRKEGNDKGVGEREGDMGVSCLLVSFSYSNCAMSILSLLYVLPLFPPLFVQQKSNADVGDVQSKPQLQ